ncbi:HAD hydrolase-like protein [bacterium]|jgi:HAD superfamily phosphatase (TIGR01668 family)|nr:HAD hydrolase-like protein [bacterium]MBT4250948.1 HAD hydrolase-like protein [bacterium]MBT4597864.1 HAD hydrolase-like protein [bacterium]MBT6753944.1 HAD hydrolase-like protein [bacterium]MBT7037373.1 HAD hydrolase-like protein [bacterium]
MKYFFETDFSHIRGHIIFLDIDGTIVPDRIDCVCQKTLENIEKLKLVNRVYLLSNNRDKRRLETVSVNTGLEYIKPLHRKPKRRILQEISSTPTEKFFVIGDQVCTDVLFAKRIGAEYIHVKRLRGENDSVKMRTIYLFDDLALMFLGFFMKI